MISWQEQIRLGKLICPVTGRRLQAGEKQNSLVNEDGSRQYPVLGGRVPVLLKDPEKTAEYFESTPMKEEYRDLAESEGKHPPSGIADAIRKKMLDIRAKDFRSGASHAAFSRVFHGPSGNALWLSIGGGPKRDHPDFFNLNIGPFLNVDLVADAHAIPYADNAVDALYAMAVFEHLHDPVLAAREMLRVLKPGGLAYVTTPFMQPYHGYPHHYRNYTLTGHTSLFRNCGFSVEDSGVDVGPTFTVTHILTRYIEEYFPRLYVRPLQAVWVLGILNLWKRADRFLNKRPNAHVLASTTYAVLRKPALP